MTAQLVLSSSLFDSVGAAAAIQAGLLGDPDERILLQGKHSRAPELVTAPASVPGADRVLSVFDRVITLNELMEPLHPTSFSPIGRDRNGTCLMLQRLLRRYWDLGDQPVELVLETLVGNPAQWLVAVFYDSPITVISDGLMSYGPTRNRQPQTVGHRITSLVHLDLVPGVRPLMLHELGVPTRPIPNESVVKVFADLADGIRAARPGLAEAGHRLDPDTPTGLVLGQYLSDLRLLTRAEEDELQGELVTAAVEAGARQIVFKPHPASPPGSIEPVRRAAAEAGVELELVTDPAPAEVLISQLSPVVVAASFSTALVTARTLYDCTIVSAGTELLLRRLRPYQNSNRIPVTIIDALTRPDSPYRTPWELQTLVDAVGHAMQPWMLESLRDGAETFWDSHPTAERARYGPPPRVTRLVKTATRRGMRAMITHRGFASIERASRRTKIRRKLMRWARL